MTITEDGSLTHVLGRLTSKLVAQGVHSNEKLPHGHDPNILSPTGKLKKLRVLLQCSPPFQGFQQPSQMPRSERTEFSDQLPGRSPDRKQSSEEAVILKFSPSEMFEM